LKGEVGKFGRLSEVPVYIAGGEVEEGGDTV